MAISAALFAVGAILAQIVPPDFAFHPSRKLWREGALMRGPELPSEWSLKRTSPESWAPAGWNTLRWAMGPADVADRLREPTGDFRLSGNLLCVKLNWSSIPDSRCYIFFEDYTLTILGAAVTPEFVFVDDRLDSINLLLHPRAREAFSRDAGEKMLADLRTLFTDEYGPPSRVYEPRPTKMGNSKLELRAVEWKSTSLSSRREPATGLGFEILMEVGWQVFDSPQPAEPVAGWYVPQNAPGGRAHVTLSYRREGWTEHCHLRALGVVTAERDWDWSKFRCTSVASRPKAGSDPEVKKVRGICVAAQSVGD